MKPSEKSLTKARELFETIADIDYKNGDYFCWKSGGEGDNGEVLIEQLAEALDSQNNQIEDSRKELIEEIIEKIEKDWYFNGIADAEDVSEFIKKHFKGSND